jgi:two-component system, OmpR family, phosphate regulon sensor histidine kinase PhoR
MNDGELEMVSERRGEQPATNEAPLRTAGGTGAIERLSIVDAHEHAHGEIGHSDVARVVHDFKGPLATIALEAEWIDECLAQTDTIGARRSLERIGRNVAFLDRMVMDLLDLCSIEAGRFALRCARTELRALIEHVVERAVPSRERSRVFLEVDERVMLDIDDLRIERVVANLLHNALRYAPRASGIVVRVDIEPTLTRVSVTDAGYALSADELSHIFDERGRRPPRSNEGSGLGLYLSKQIIEAHGGTIGAESIRGVGTRFFFELPASGSRPAAT